MRSRIKLFPPNPLSSLFSLSKRSGCVIISLQITCVLYYCRPSSCFTAGKKGGGGGGRREGVNPWSQCLRPRGVLHYQLHFLCQSNRVAVSNLQLWAIYERGEIFSLVLRKLTTDSRRLSQALTACCVSHGDDPRWPTLAIGGIITLCVQMQTACKTDAFIWRTPPRLLEDHIKRSIGVHSEAQSHTADTHSTQFPKHPSFPYYVESK